MGEKIEEVFGTKVYNLYGSREVVSLVGECKHGLMHLFAFGGYVEIEDNNNQADDLDFFLQVIYSWWR